MQYIKNGRIIPQNIPHLYDKLNIDPVFRIWGDPCSKSPCGCLVTALLTDYIGAIGALSITNRSSTDGVDGVAERASEILGLGHNYTLGLIDGFDGKKEMYVIKEDNKLNGHKDGTLARKAILKVIPKQS
jgi:hypothetical protein